MSGQRWTDFANIGVIEDDDQFPIADLSEPVGTRQRTVFVSQLRARLSGATVAAGAPSALADETQNYSVGSLWFNTVAELFYVCTDATEDAAVWEVITSGGGGSASEIDGKEVDTTGAGYFAEVDGTTNAKDLLWYNGTKYVADRPRRGKWRRITGTYTLTTDDHELFIYSAGGDIEFNLSDFPTGFEFAVYVASSPITVSRAGSGAITFATNDGVIGNTSTSIELPPFTFAWFSRTQGDVIATNIVSRQPRVPVASVSSSRAANSTDGDKHVRFTSAGTLTLPADLAVGTAFTVAHQAGVGEPVGVAAGSGVTVVSLVGSIGDTDDPLLVDEFGAVMCIKVTSTVWEVYGALAEPAS